MPATVMSSPLVPECGVPTVVKVATIYRPIINVGAIIEALQSNPRKNPAKRVRNDVDLSDCLIVA